MDSNPGGYQRTRAVGIGIQALALLKIPETSHRSAYYACLNAPLSERAREDQRLLGLVKRSWLVVGGIYDHRKITLHLRNQEDACGRRRVGRLMK